MLEEDSDDPNEKGKTFDDTQSGRQLPYRKYDGLTVSVTPGGVVYLWVFGQMDQVQLGRYQAKETEVDWRILREHGEREETKKGYMEEVFSDKVKREIETNSLPYGLWDTYGERFLWKYTVEGATPIYHLHFQTINSEEEGFFPPLLGNDQYKERAVPYWFDFYFKDNQGKGYNARVYFTKDRKYYNVTYQSGLDPYWQMILRRNKPLKYLRK